MGKTSQNQNCLMERTHNGNFLSYIYGITSIKGVLLNLLKHTNGKTCFQMINNAMSE